jgi:hypothetical protein
MEPMQQQGQQQMGQGPAQEPQGPQDSPPPTPGGQGQDLAQDPTQDPTQAGAPPPPPVDPITAVITAVMSMPAPETIRQVYRVAASAARAKTELQAAGSQLDARGYHAILSRAPEERYAKELVAARRELDDLAGERRRLGLEAQKARTAGNNARASVYEVQSGQVDAAMEQVAAGVLLWLALPAHALDPQQQSAQQPTQQQQQQQPPQPAPPQPPITQPTEAVPNA